MVKMKVICLVSLIIALKANVVPKYQLFKRVLKEAPAQDSQKSLSLNAGVSNPAVCAKHCKNEECSSFSYKEDGQVCETYSQSVVVRNESVPPSQSFFKKVVTGVAQISPGGINMDVFLDADTPNGPWVVIQRRESGNVNFYRNWVEYKDGFGDLPGEFWLGNDNIHLLTKTAKILRVELEAWDGTHGYAQYSEFKMLDESTNYKLHIQGFSGNVSFDAMDFHDGMMFTTYDRDNDVDVMNCAETPGRGGWWYGSCFRSNLNGVYSLSMGQEDSSAVVWWQFPDPNIHQNPLKKTTMMIKFSAF